MLSFLSLFIVPAVLGHKLSLERHKVSLASPHHNVSLSARGGNRFSNYDVEESEGACGTWNKNSEYVVALTQTMWNGGANCFKEVHITVDGKSATAKIVDECMECPYGALDFSQSLFGHFVGGEQNNEEVGYIYGDWSYGGGGGGGSDDDDDDKETTTKKTTTKHTTSTKTTSTSTSTKTPTSTKSEIKTTSTSSASKSSASASASAVALAPSSSPSPSAAVPSASPTASPAAAQNMQDFTQALLNLSGLIMRAPQAA
ncbi:RlpA-like double-psi beta-barrel-protein domain-containing protein-containing protein [Mycena crocata]|nr:RlpA-like double-psi beta-barrel-protein domain-containing protein-containing protein [Mycena crocata]